MLELNRTFNAATKAQRALSNKQAARKYLIEAQQHLAALREVLKEGEHGSFTDWF